MAAAANADWKSQPGFDVILTNQPGAASWPIAGATFILVHKTAEGPGRHRREALKFFAWAYKNGDKMAEDLDYVPMPDNVVKHIEQNWKSEIKDANGKPDLCDEVRPTSVWKRRRHGAFSLSTAR